MLPRLLLQFHEFFILGVFAKRRIFRIYLTFAPNRDLVCVKKTLERDFELNLDGKIRSIFVDLFQPFFQLKSRLT